MLSRHRLARRIPFQAFALRPRPARGTEHRHACRTSRLGSGHRRRFKDALLLGSLVVVLIPLFAFLNAGGLDFDRQFYLAGQSWPAIFEAVPVQQVKQGGIFGIFLPWAVVLVQPFTLLPVVWARAIIQACTVIALIALAGRKPHAIFLALYSAPAIHLIFYQANLDAISGFGTLLPPAGGLVLLAMKPQALGLAALVWLSEKRWQAFLPAALIIALATLLWPEWITRVREAPAGAMNVSFFPWSLLIALPLLYIALRRRDVLLAALATPLTVPYVAIYSLAPAIALLARRHWLLGLLANSTSWVGLYFLSQRMVELR